MPRFRDPDIDPALNAEAQALVDDATASMKQWLDERFDEIEANVQRELDQIVKEIEDLTSRFAAEDAERTAALEELLEDLGEATGQLTTLDEDQRQVIEQLAGLSEAVRTELAERTERWQGLGAKAVQLTSQTLKRALGGII